MYFSGIVIFVLRESISIQPNFFALSRMAMLEDLSLVTGRDLVPLSDVREVASLIRLGAFLLMKGKEGAQLLLEVIGEELCNWSPFLAAE